MPSQSGQPVRKDQVKDAFRTCLTRYRRTDLNQVQSEAKAPELWGAAQKSPRSVPPAELQGERGSNADLRSGCRLYSTQSVIIKGNGIFQGMGVLLTQTIETDTPSFYTFGK